MPDDLSRISRALEDPWLESDDLWPLRRALESEVKRHPRAASVLARVNERLGERRGDDDTGHVRAHGRVTPAELHKEAAHRSHARFLIERDDRPALRAVLERALAWDDAWATRMLARLDVVEGRGGAARERIAALMRRIPWRHDLEREVARSFDAEGRWVDAERALRREIARAPREARPYFELATVLLHAGRNDAVYEAYQDLYRAIPGEPDAPYFVCAMARVVEAMPPPSTAHEGAPTPKRDDALQVCAHARRVRPGDIRIALEIARVLVQRGRTDDAQRVLVEERDLNVGDEHRWRQLIEWEFEMRRFPAAQLAALHATTFFPLARWPADSVARAERALSESM